MPRVDTEYRWRNGDEMKSAGSRNATADAAAESPAKPVIVFEIR